MLRVGRLIPLTVFSALLVLAATIPLRAVGPYLIMFYGGDLKAPALVFPGNPSYNPTSFLWSPANGGVPYISQKRGTLPPNLEGRRYIGVAIFWRRVDPTTVKASDASQHGRIYLATASAPAVIVITAPRMVNPNDPASPPDPVPIPSSLDEFIAGWPLNFDIHEWIQRQTNGAQ